MFKLLNMKYEALNPWVYFAFWQSFILHLVLDKLNNDDYMNYDDRVNR